MDKHLQMLRNVKNIDGLALATCYHPKDLRYAQERYAETGILIPLFPRYPIRKILILGDPEGVAEFCAATNDFPKSNDT